MEGIIPDSERGRAMVERWKDERERERCRVIIRRLRTQRSR